MDEGNEGRGKKRDKEKESKQDSLFLSFARRLGRRVQVSSLPLAKSLLAHLLSSLLLLQALLTFPQLAFPPLGTSVPTRGRGGAYSLGLQGQGEVRRVLHEDLARIRREVERTGREEEEGREGSF